MASVRDIVNFQDLYVETATFKSNGDFSYSASAVGGSTAVGLAVKMTSDQTVGLTTDASHVLGKLLFMHDVGTFCTVQTGGYMFLPEGASITLTVGKKIVGSLGASSAKGYIREVAAAILAEVVVARGLVVDTSTAADYIQNGTSTTGAAVIL